MWLGILNHIGRSRNQTNNKRNIAPSSIHNGRNNLYEQKSRESRCPMDGKHCKIAKLRNSIQMIRPEDIATKRTIGNNKEICCIHRPSMAM